MKEETSSSLFLFGHFCCRVAVKTPKLSEYSGYIRILYESSQRNAVRENDWTKELNLEANEVETRTTRKNQEREKNEVQDKKGMNIKKTKAFHERICWSSLQDFHHRLWYLPVEVQDRKKGMKLKKRPLLIIMKTKKRLESKSWKRDEWKNPT